jgi:hypothetical protein
VSGDTAQTGSRRQNESLGELVSSDGKGGEPYNDVVRIRAAAYA